MRRSSAFFIGIITLFSFVYLLNRPHYPSLKRFPKSLHEYLRNNPALKRGTSFHRGIALGLYSQDPTYNYASLLREIRAHGANRVSLFITLYQEEPTSVSIAPRIHRTVQNKLLQRTIRSARLLGLRVMIVPIVLLAPKYRKGKHWRGNINPTSPKQWFLNYQKEIVRLARLAQHEKVESFSIGSEFASMEKYGKQWNALIYTIRSVFKGLLTYSANWDHYRNVPFWHHLDIIGISGYFQLSKSPNPSFQQMLEQWHWIRNRLLIWRRKKHYKQPIIFTELGYPNMDGASTAPWDYNRRVPTNPYEQALCYEAFIHIWHKTQSYGGVYFYNWFGFASLSDRSYSPRGKPAASLIKAWYHSLTLIP